MRKEKERKRDGTEQLRENEERKKEKKVEKKELSQISWGKLSFHPSFVFYSCYILRDERIYAFMSSR